MRYFFNRLILPIGLAAVAPAHPGHDDVVHHIIRVVPQPEHVEVRVTIEFPPGASLHEREKMDSDRDGRIDAEEQTRYLDEVARAADAELSLAVNGTSERLMALYEPKLSLEGKTGVTEHPHTVELAYFSDMPPKAGTSLTLTDETWVEQPARFTLEPSERGPLRVRPEQGNRHFSPQSPLVNGERSFIFKLVAEERAPNRVQPNRTRTNR